MFERRLKIVLFLLGAFIAGLIARSASVQLVNRDYWKKEAADAMKRPRLVETTRGRILDVRGRVLAEDRPCIDACVDYRVIPEQPDEKWLRNRAIQRLHAELGDPYGHASRSSREELRDFEIERVKADVDNMWVALSRLSHRPIEEIQAARESITRRVEMRRRYVWYHNFDRAQKAAQAAHQDASFWNKWIAEGTKTGTDLDKFMVTVAEELEPHVLLPAVDNDTQNELGKQIDQYPGLSLRPGTHRFYPYGDVAAHLLGHLGHVSHEDLEKVAAREHGELREYLPNDALGKTGVEEMCEPVLRGSRGKIETLVGDDRVTTLAQPVAGQDVRLSIDIDLQQQIQMAFAEAKLRDSKTGQVLEEATLHGAAVVIDVKTGQVRAMVSYPTYDPNHLDEQYAQLVKDELNRPLMNRATMSQLEPGSTVKPMVGMAALTEGVIKPDEGIECTGYLVLDDHRQKYGARCWVASTKSIFEALGGHVAHHPVPYVAPHPTGFLTVSDGIERSCNVVFETLADRLGVERLSDWYTRFGLGRVTGIGIGEAKGRLPTVYPMPKWKKRSIGWYAGIGQGYVLATPIQMANVAATVARNGIWMRPTLLATDDQAVLASDSDNTPSSDRVDLHISPAAIKAVHDGMVRVVSSLAGTGTGVVAGDKLLQSLEPAAKTGSAQAARLRYQGQFLIPSTKEQPNTLAPWYRAYGGEGTDIAHGWYIGFAPANDPQIAFAVLVEYGGSGGGIAGSVAREVLAGCVEHGYLHPPGDIPSTASADRQTEAAREDQSH